MRAPIGVQSACRMNMLRYLHLELVKRSLLVVVACCALVLPGARGQVQEQAAEPASEAPSQEQQTRQQLQGIQKSIQDKRALIDQLRKQLKRETDEGERRELESRIEREDAEIGNLRRSFEDLALGGVDLSVFDPERQDEVFDWKNELQLILKPLFQELKELTENPRQIERLRVRLALLEKQQRVAKRALSNVERLQDDSLDKAARQRLSNLHQSWSQRLEDIQREHETSALQLEVLLSQGETIPQQIGNAAKRFFTGRGLNLALSIAAFLLTWFLMKGMYLLYTRLSWKRVASTTGRRIVEYGYQALTLVAAIMTALVVLYLAGDTLLLVLALILLLFILIGLRNYLPRFLDEAKLLLNLGAVRERERVVYDGLPWMVRSIGVYSRLFNPALEGLLRLPLSEMQKLASRPYREEEPWFPTQAGDWVLMGDSTLGQVLRQTPEIVQIKTGGSIRTYTATNFLAAEPRNLSQGFGVAVTFGIDYQHQAASTNEVPRILRESIEWGLQQTTMGPHVEDILVELQEAGASSLNYLIFLTMKGAAAESYGTLRRLVQRICVDTCNERGWVIPFNQVTVHTASGPEVAAASAAAGVSWGQQIGNAS
jgi:small-conductance mechanosensitive channel